MHSTRNLRSYIRPVSILITALAMSLAAVGPATAATAPGSGTGIKISPVRTDLTINPGQTQTVVISVQNVTSGPATFQALVNDFVAKDETGQPSLILDSTQYAPSHSLKRFVGKIPNFSVAAGATASVKVPITVPKDAAGGGYYGAVRFAPVSPGGGSQNVILSASVGSLILVRVPGNISENLTIASFDVRRGADANSASSFFTSSNGLVAMVRFDNKGNVQEQPFGKIDLKKGSHVLQTSEINNADPRGNVLPGSIRRFSVSLSHLSWGKYTVDGNFGYGSNGQLLSASSSFYVVPVLALVLLGAGVVVLVFLIWWVPRAIRRYNQRVLRRAGRR